MMERERDAQFILLLLLRVLAQEMIMESERRNRKSGEKEGERLSQIHKRENSRCDISVCETQNPPAAHKCEFGIEIHFPVFQS